MSSDFRAALLALCVTATAGIAMDYSLVRAEPLATPPVQRVPRKAELRVCADPNNLPFSNARGEGFENALARLLAADLGMTLRYTWWPQRRGFVRNTLNAGACDVIMGVPASYRMAQPTQAYYRSSFVFVSRRDRDLHIRSFDDPRLRTLRIGVHAVGGEGGGVPPVEALAIRGIVGNIHGYSIYGDYSQPNPPKALIDAVAQGDIDVAIAWGPLAGYFAQREPVPLEINAVDPAARDAHIPMTFAIAMGVRRGDGALRSALEGAIQRQQRAIDSVLTRFGVPLLEPAEPARMAHAGADVIGE